MSKALESENTKLESVQFGHRVQSPVAEKAFLQIKNSDGSNSDGSNSDGSNSDESNSDGSNSDGSKVTDRIVH